MIGWQLGEFPLRSRRRSCSCQSSAWVLANHTFSENRPALLTNMANPSADFKLRKYYTFEYCIFWRRGASSDEVLFTNQSSIVEPSLSASRVQKYLQYIYLSLFFLSVWAPALAEGASAICSLPSAPPSSLPSEASSISETLSQASHLNLVFIIMIL